MIKTTIIIVVTLLCLNFGNKTHGKSQQELTPANVKGNTKFTIKGTPGSVVRITCWRNQFYKFDYLLDTTINFNDQTIYLSVNLGQLAYLSLSQTEPKKMSTTTDFILNSGDDLQFDLKLNAVTCTGKGAERFNVKRTVAAALLKLRMDSLEMKGKLDFEKQLIWSNKVLETTLKVWAENQSLFDQVTYQKNIIDIIYLARTRQLTLLSMSLKNKQSNLDSTYTQRLRNLISWEVNREYSLGLDSNLMLYSNWFRESCLMKAMLLESQFPDFTAEKQTSVIFEHLYQKYSGNLRAFLLTQWLSKRIKRGDSESFNLLLNRLANITNDSLLIDVITQLKRGTAQHVKSYAASLPNESGKSVMLNDFKGKILVVDFWYTGCVNCIKYGEQTLKPAYQQLKDDSDIVFLSVSIDKDKDVWLKSLKGGAYTLPTSINLYTAGIGDKHPLIDYYQVVSYPQLVVLDKNGETYSTSYTTRDPNKLVSILTQLKTIN